jgi:hypothetical protein
MGIAARKDSAASLPTRTLTMPGDVPSGWKHNSEPPKETVAMSKATPRSIRLFALLVLVVLVAYLAVHRHGLTANQATGEAGGEVIQAGSMATRDGYAIVASLVFVALVGFVAWTVLRASKGEDEAVPPAKEPDTGDITKPR